MAKDYEKQAHFYKEFIFHEKKFLDKYRYGSLDNLRHALKFQGENTSFFEALTRLESLSDLSNAELPLDESTIQRIVNEVSGMPEYLKLSIAQEKALQLIELKYDVKNFAYSKLKNRGFYLTCIKEEANKLHLGGELIAYKTNNPIKFRSKDGTKEWNEKAIKTEIPLSDLNVFYINRRTGEEHKIEIP